MADTITIFGKEYPLYSSHGNIVPNCVSFADYLPDFFKTQKHFSAEEYSATVEQLFPDFKKKWYQKAPSEKDIESYFINQHGSAAMDGANSVPQAEEKLGIKIGGGYKYPKGMTDIEYHAYIIGQVGLYSPYRVPNPKNQQEAYMDAWQEMHYPRDKMLSVLQQQYQELVELNPQLKEIKLDTNNPRHLTMFRAGVTYDFPVADINLFITEDKSGARIGLNNSERMKRELSAIGLDVADFGWVLSSETIQEIGKKLQEKNAQKTTEQEEVKTSEAEEKPKTPKEIVEEKLKSWGIEDGTYMLITPEDNLYTNADPKARSVSVYLEDGAMDITKTGRDVVYGTNNDHIGAYFKEGVYVVSTNLALRDALYYHQGENVGLGVILSNAESFVHADGSRDNKTNDAWANIKHNGDKISDERIQAYEAKQKMKEELNNATAADKVHKTLEKLCEFGDKYDTSGVLKEKLAQVYVTTANQMTGVEFWGTIVQQYGDKAPEGRDKMVLEAGQLGANITQELKANTSNIAYNAVKKRCAETKNSDEMRKAAHTCSVRSHNNASAYMTQAQIGQH